MNPMLEIATLERSIELLLADYPELASDEELRADVLEGQTDLHAVMTRIIRKANEAKAFQSALTYEIDSLRDRSARYERRCSAMRDLALRILQHAELTKLELPIATVSVRAGVQSVRITDEDALTDDYINAKMVITPNKTAIKESLQLGIAVPGAALSNGSPSLTIRIR